MSTFIHHIETLCPPHCYRQDYARDLMIDWLHGKKTRRIIRGIYNHSGIDTRYSVLPDFSLDATPIMFRRGPNGEILEPSTEERNQYFAEASRDLSIEISRRTLQNAGTFQPQDITHIITVSCTGFCNPGADFEIIRALGLSHSVERYHLGFMGCYAAFPALKMADQFCLARPDAVVLIVCLELCSLHLKLREEPDSLLANALFADGTATALVSARLPQEHRPAFVLNSFQSALAPEGEMDMAWSIGNQGFNMRLSSYVPDIIASNIDGIVKKTLALSPWKQEEIGTWAVHPGGRAVLDKVEKELGLSAEQIADSRTILRDFGNMSSATILFVLKRILSRAEALPDRPVCAMAFGPGLTVETALLELVMISAGKPLKEISKYAECTMV